MSVSRRPGRGRTLRYQLARVAVLATAAWVVALTAVFNALLVTSLGRQVDQALQTRAAAVAATIEVSSAGAISVRDAPNDEALDAGVWIFQGSRAVEQAVAPTAVQHAVRGLAAAQQGFVRVNGSPDVRLYALPVRRSGQRVGTVVTAQSLAANRRTSQTALVGSILLGLLVIAGVYAVTRRVLNQALAPVTEMAERAAAWSAHDVRQRFGAEPRPGELAELAASLDSLLDRIGAVLRHEQQLAAELSHELRTPLALIAAENEWLAGGARDPEDRARASEVIATTVDRMGHLLDTLLAQAAQEVREAPGRCAVRPVLAAALAPVQESGDLLVSIRCADGLEAGVDPDVLTRILTPLVGNARRYARSTVSARAERDGGVVMVRVQDDGPGVPEAFVPSVFDPGSRAEPDDGHPGAGLGLALARRLARAAGGELALENSNAPANATGRDGADGREGATFLVTLPAV